MKVIQILISRSALSKSQLKNQLEEFQIGKSKKVKGENVFYREKKLLHVYDNFIPLDLLALSWFKKN